MRQDILSTTILHKEKNLKKYFKIGITVQWIKLVKMKRIKNGKIFIKLYKIRKPPMIF